MFDVEMPRVSVIVHPQSVVHSMVEYIDGSLIAQLSSPDMCLPIQYALTYPDRVSNDRVQTNFAQIGSLEFEDPDIDKFPALRLAREAGEVGGAAPAVLNAANEEAVAAFVDRKIGFTQIPEVVESTLKALKSSKSPSLEEILESDRWARDYSRSIIGG